MSNLMDIQIISFYTIFNNYVWKFSNKVFNYSKYGINRWVDKAIKPWSSNLKKKHYKTQNKICFIKYGS